MTQPNNSLKLNIPILLNKIIQTKTLHILFSAFNLILWYSIINLFVSQARELNPIRRACNPTRVRKHNRVVCCISMQLFESFYGIIKKLQTACLEFLLASCTTSALMSALRVFQAVTFCAPYSYFPSSACTTPLAICIRDSSSARRVGLHTLNERAA